MAREDLIAGAVAIAGFAILFLVSAYWAWRTR